MWLMFHYESWSQTESLCMGDLRNVRQPHSKIDICVCSSYILFERSPSFLFFFKIFPFTLPCGPPHIWAPFLFTDGDTLWGQVPMTWSVSWSTSNIQFYFFNTHDSTQSKAKQKWGLIDHKYSWHHQAVREQDTELIKF